MRFHAKNSILFQYRLRLAENVLNVFPVIHISVAEKRVPFVAVRRDIKKVRVSRFTYL